MRRAVTALAVAAALGPALAGCGFTPMYADPGVRGGLPRIEVVASQGRAAYRLREALDDDLGRDRSAPPMWRLEFNVKQSRDARGLRLNNVAERYELGLKVDYTLTELSTGKVVHSGQITSQVSYDAADAPYAGIAARQDSQDRAAADAARRIEADIAAFLARRGGG